MPYETELFHATVKAIGDNDRTKKIVLGKWQEYTFQYESGFGIVGQKSRLTVWRFGRVVLVVNCQRLTVNDSDKITIEAGEAFDIQGLIEAVVGEEVIGIGSPGLLWRITLGGYIAKRQSNSPSKGC